MLLMLPTDKETAIQAIHNNNTPTTKTLLVKTVGGNIIVYHKMTPLSATMPNGFLLLHKLKITLVTVTRGVGLPVMADALSVSPERVLL